MAETVRDYTRTVEYDGAIVFTYTGLDGDDSGKPFKLPLYNDKSMHCWAESGAWSGSITLEGSIDLRADPDHADHANAKWLPLTNSQGEEITKTEDDMDIILEVPLWIRPKQTGGTDANITIAIMCIKRK